MAFLIWDSLFFCLTTMVSVVDLLVPVNKNFQGTVSQI
jgi:hypothetical protein